jgi:hypothetical protein
MDEKHEGRPLSEAADACQSTHDYTSAVETATDLEHARNLVRSGVVVFSAPPNPTSSTGFALPKNWQHLTPDLKQVDRWQPGWALCAVTGTLFDLLDVDVRNDGDQSRKGLIEGGLWPDAYGVAETPSGGWHEFVAPLGVGSRDGFKPGLDLKGGRDDGSSRGFAFIAPTMRASKTTGEIVKYRWVTPIDVDALKEGDESGAGIAQLVFDINKSKRARSSLTNSHESTIGEGQRHQALVRYAGRLRHRGLSIEEAKLLIKERWESCAQPPKALTPFPLADALAIVRDVFGRYEAGIEDEVEGTFARTTGRRIVVTAASSIEPRRVSWLWEGRIALGTLSLIAGPEGLGKSTAAYSLAAQLTRGELRGAFFGKPKAVLIAASEDSWEHTIVPRLMAANADLDRVFQVEVVTTDDLHMPLTLPKDVDGLKLVAREQDAALLILDPLTSRVDAKLDTHRDAETRRALEPLAALADQADLGIIGLIHHNKSSQTDPLNLVMASKAFTAVARSVHTIIRDPEDESGQARLLGTSKNNLGTTDLPVLRFIIESHEVPTTDGPASTGKIKWIENAQGTIVDAVRRAAEPIRDRTAAAEAVDWLTDYMLTQGGRAASADVKRAGFKAGHSEDSLKRARKSLGLKVVQRGFPRATIWVDEQSEHTSQSTVWGESLTALTESKVHRLSQSVQSVQSEFDKRRLTLTEQNTVEANA